MKKHQKKNHEQKQTFKHLFIELLQIIRVSGSQEHHILIAMEARHLFKCRRKRSLQLGN